MSIALRIVLIVAAVALAAFMFRSIRKSKLRIEDSIFWIFLTLLILILAIFPQIASFFSGVMGFQAPVNLIFLFFFFVLLMKCYFMSRHISQLETKIRELSEQIALDRLDHYERTTPHHAWDDDEAAAVDAAGEPGPDQR